jgi:hypothetical protein
MTAGCPVQSTDVNSTPLTESKTACADTGAGKTEVIAPLRVIDGGLHHQMIKQIDLHRFYVYPSRAMFAGVYSFGSDPNNQEILMIFYWDKPVIFRSPAHSQDLYPSDFLWIFLLHASYSHPFRHN